MTCEKKRHIKGIGKVQHSGGQRKMLCNFNTGQFVKIKQVFHFIYKMEHLAVRRCNMFSSQS